MLRTHKTHREQGIYRAICSSVGTARKYLLHAYHMLIVHEYHSSGNNVASFVVSITKYLSRINTGGCVMWLR